MRNNEKCKIMEVIRKNGEIWTDLMCFLIYFESKLDKTAEALDLGNEGEKETRVQF